MKELGMKVATGILETAIYVDDIDKAQSFYSDIFGLELVSKLDDKFVFFKCGDAMLLIFNANQSSIADPSNPIPRHGAHGAGHFCFRANSAAEVQEWKKYFEQKGVPIERYHIWKPTGAHSIYVRDPGNNSVEVGEAKIWGFE